MTFDVAGSVARAGHDRSAAWRFIEGFAAAWTEPIEPQDGWTRADLAVTEEQRAFEASIRRWAVDAGTIAAVRARVGEVVREYLPLVERPTLLDALRTGRDIGGIGSVPLSGGV